MNELGEPTKDISFTRTEMHLIRQALLDAAFQLKYDSPTGKAVQTLLSRIDCELTWWNAGR